ncbi:helix-turn-helix domain-containing protein [Murdochiella massiliensis]|uniref:helix-turn-helix domain-containing protein n=1 Tax=Murdochiella massiliensis TaxID=1673723 RepID=UPI0008330839|nr:helix-turn-helix transcriptional regulator [Murdochiella massiliensis]
MNFGEKIRKYRKDNKIRQENFAIEIGVSTRTLSMYESGQRYPKSVKVYKKIADVMKVDYNYLLEDTDHFLSRVQGRYGNREMNKIQALTEGIAAMFAGGTLSDEDRDAAFATITEAYWKTKQAADRRETPAQHV